MEVQQHLLRCGPYCLSALLAAPLAIVACRHSLLMLVGFFSVGECTAQVK